MSLVEIRSATRKHLEDMCRSVDMNERDCAVMLKWYNSSAYSWAGFYKDNIACLYGVQSATILSDTGYLWLVTNALVKEHPFLFVRHSQIVVQKLLKEYETINGHTFAWNTNGAQWLEWLGVKLRRQEAINGLVPFELKRSA